MQMWHRFAWLSSHVVTAGLAFLGYYYGTEKWASSSDMLHWARLLMMALNASVMSHYGSADILSGVYEVRH